MRRTLLTLIATVIALVVTLVCRTYVLSSFAGQSSNTLFAPWVLLEASFVFLAALCLFAIVWRWARQYACLIMSATVYLVGTLPASSTWLQHPASFGDAFGTYLAVFLPQVAVVSALLIVFFYSKRGHAKL
jgi:hypothetical protein